VKTPMACLSWVVYGSHGLPYVAAKGEWNEKCAAIDENGVHIGFNDMFFWNGLRSG
jgi:hypothetical protein